ncbi:conserved hypothetical protein [Gloeothece citriformis PCC 7424]|uniref:Uncharacterized protein n=1 Tax=Gloeothece citriformis (strain PCC 7424) TaxID=65393 RepID=B7KIW1_GLOC7|nr:hypothetical protein [Gloeothece citriformis]ACK70797.1 conserved hypothetical protein [Gloeothece citriformis PCC 7424]
MSKYNSFRQSRFTYFFVASLLLTLVVYILRGIGTLSFIPGGLILILIALSIITGLIYAIDKTKRF